MKTIGLILSLMVGAANATELQFNSIDEANLQGISKEFSSNFLHTSVSGANTLGSIWGFEVGVIAGWTRTPNLESLVHQVDPSADIERIPSATLLGALTVPLGITIETNLVPKVGSSDLKYAIYSLAAKWTLTEIVFPEIPFSIAAKASVTKDSVEGNTIVNGTATTINYDGSIFALQAFVSKDLEIIEPYIGLGYVSERGTLGTGAGRVFNANFTTASSATVSSSGTQFILGTEVKLNILKFGIEYANTLGVSHFDGKVSVYF